MAPRPKKIMGPTKQEILDAFLKEKEINDRLVKEELAANLFKFNRHVLMVDQGKGKMPLAPFHKQLCEFVTEDKNKKKLILTPRAHLKSTLITVGYSLQRIVYDPSIRILIANATYKMSTAFLSSIKRHLDGNQTLINLYGKLAEEPIKWSEDMITLKAAKEVQGKKEATVTAFGMGGNLVSQHYDLILLDDIVNRDMINTREQIDKTILFYKDVLDLADSQQTEFIIIGCLLAGTKVLMADGSLKSIEKIKRGEKVVSHDSTEVVEAMIPQRKGRVYELKTRNHTIYATPNHPFLTERGFVRLDSLKKKEKIVVCRRYSPCIDKISKENDDLWALGFMLGDGWITENPNKYGSMRFITCFAKGVYSETNQKVLSILGKLGKFKETSGGYYRTENIAVAKYLKKLGFKGNAKTKRIPRYVFCLKNELREAFLDGFLKADGYVSNKLRCTELSNKDLVRDVKNLAEICGHKVSNIFSRTRMIKAPHSHEKVISTTHHISIGNRKKKSRWDWERVVSIKYIGKREVYDLTVSNTHNFIAEGMVVHNTRWHDRDLYDWILNPDNQIIQGFKVMIKGAYEGNLEGDDFQSLWPQKFTRDYLKELLRDKGPYEFSCQYKNNPVPDETAVFRNDWFQYYDETELKGRPLNKFILVDPAISQEKEADYTAMVVLGIDHFGFWYVLDIFHDRVTPSQLINEVFFLNERWHPIDIGIEDVAFQKTLQYSIQEEMKKRNIFLPIREVKPQLRSKDERIRGLQPLYANGIIYHNRSLVYNDYLEDELMRFPRGRFDDIIDALSYGKDLAITPKRKRGEQRDYVSYSPFI